jgi:L-methionine (R)-S-oxide reductase
VLHVPGGDSRAVSLWLLPGPGREVGPRLISYTPGMDRMDEVVDRLSRRARFDWVGVYLVEGDELVLGPYRGETPVGHERIPMGEGVCGAVAASGATEVVPDVSARGGHIQCFIGTRSEVVAPIVRDGRVIGVLDIDSDTLDAFGPDEVKVVEEAAGEIASA